MYTRELLAAIHCTTRDRRPPPLVPALDHALTPAPTMPAPALQPRPCPRPHSSPAPAGTLILVPPLPLFSSQSRPQPAQAEALAQQQIPLTQSYRLRLPGPVMTSALPSPDTKHLSSPILPCPRSAPSLAQTYTFAGPTLHHPQYRYRRLFHNPERTLTFPIKLHRLDPVITSTPPLPKPGTKTHPPTLTLYCPCPRPFA